uniref:Peptidase S1 domain-containing protein n=1 Tax=Anopheles atroparvus TaxID=41427 RepID=A0AAG5DBT2_ANOAO
MGKLVALLLVLLAAGGLAQQTTLRSTVPGEFPSVVVIKTPRDRQFCLGTVLNANHVLTSAPCVLTDDSMRIFPPRLVHVSGGDLLILPIHYQRQTRTAEHIFVHENYRPHTRENNLAVIRLAEPFHLPSNAIEEVQIQMRILPDNHPCDVVRMLQPGDTEPTSARVQQAFNVNIRNRDVCIERRPWELTIREDLLCMELTTGTGFNTVEGDPMFCDGRQAAILSFRWNSNRGGGESTTHLAATQIRFHIHWIHQQLNRTHPMPPGWNPVNF